MFSSGVRAKILRPVLVYTWREHAAKKKKKKKKEEEEEEEEEAEKE